jgi:hypothetical protein
MTIPPMPVVGFRVGDTLKRTVRGRSHSKKRKR